MIARDSKGRPGPTRSLLPETVKALRAALKAQARAGQEPLPELRDAVRRVDIDATSRGVMPDALFAELKELLAEVSTERSSSGAVLNRGIQQWLMNACFRAYWE